MLAKYYLQKQILSDPVLISPINLNNNSDMFAWLNGGSIEKAIDIRIGDIEQKMRKAIAAIDQATGKDIIMLHDTYNDILQRLKNAPARNFTDAEIGIDYIIGTHLECIEAYETSAKLLKGNSTVTMLVNSGTGHQQAYDLDVIDRTVTKDDLYTAVDQIVNLHGIDVKTVHIDLSIYSDRGEYAPAECVLNRTAYFDVIKDYFRLTEDDVIVAEG